MSYQDAREMRKDYKENRTNAYKNIIWWILSTLVVGILCIIYSVPIKNLFSSQKPVIEQISTGTQGQNIGNVGRDLTITNNYIDNLILDLEQLKSTTLEGRTYTVEELVDIMRENRKERTHKSIEQEAESDADIFLSTTLLRLEELAIKKQQHKNYLDALPDACDRVFKKFVIPYIDAFFKSRNFSDLIKMEIIADIDVLFDEKCAGYPIRIIRFSGSSFIKVLFSPGVISEDQISCYPEMIFNGLSDEDTSIKGARFDIHKPKGTIIFGGSRRISFPTPNENGELDETFYRGLKSFKKVFKDRFEKLIVKMIEHSNQG